MYNPFSLNGKTILVTGGSSGIGRATAIECGKLGANVVVTGRNPERLKGVFDELDTSAAQRHQMVVADLATTDGIDCLTAALPNLDGLSSNAGTIVGNKPIRFLNEMDIQSIMQTNTFAHVLLAKLLFKKKLLNKGASCVFTVSIGGTLSHVPGSSIYGMSKAALDSFVKYAAIEFSARGIRCNSVCPGMIDTPLVNSPTLTDEDMAIDAQKYLLKRYGKSEEVARTAAFLLSDASSFITGTSIVVDGGYTVNH